MKRVDMKSEKKTMPNGKPMPTIYGTPDEPEYPYGLKISLDDAGIKKLKLGNAKKGDTIIIDAYGSIESVSDDKSGKRVEIQIKKIAVEGDDFEEYGSEKTPAGRRIEMSRRRKANNG